VARLSGAKRRRVRPLNSVVRRHGQAMHFRDLSTSTQIASGPFVRAIGWLASGHSFERGSAKPEFLTAVRSICAHWQQSVTALGWPIAAGPHTCDFCGTYRASGNVGVPSGDLLFVAPEMLAHYVEAHDYSPPAEFVAAAITTPCPGTAEYAAAIQRFVESRRAV
jgi:hypothetical protein